MGSSDQTTNLVFTNCFHQYFSVEKENKFLIGPKWLFLLSWKNQYKYILRNIGEENLWNQDSQFRSLIWCTYFKFKIFVNRMSKLAIMLELVGLLTLAWIANFVIMAKRFFAWMETWKQPLVNFCMAGSKLIMENIHTEVNLTKVVVI